MKGAFVKVNILVISLFLFLFLVSSATPVEGIFTEWWYSASSHEGNSCAYTAFRDIGFRVNVPANTHVRFMIPRAYKMGEEAGFMNRFHLITDIMNQNIIYVDNIDDCPQNIPDDSSTSNADPPGPYICFTGDQNQASKIRIDDIMGGEEGANDPRFEHAKFAGSVFDKNNEVSGMWPAHSIFFIKEFAATRGLVYYDDANEAQVACDEERADNPLRDCSGLDGSDLQQCNSENAATTSAVQSACDQMNSAFADLGSGTVMNGFPSKTLHRLDMKSNGREGIGDPWYIVIDFDNTRKRTRSSTQANSWGASAGVDPTGPEWESGLEGWESPGEPIEVGASASGPSSNFFDIWGDQWDRMIDYGVDGTVYGSIIGTAILPGVGTYVGAVAGGFTGVVVGAVRTAWNSITGRSRRVCVFGCHDVTVDVIMGVGSRVMYAAATHEFHGHDYDPMKMGTVCAFNSPWSGNRDNALADGFVYSCDPNTNQHMRYNFRVTCTNRLSTACSITADSSSSQTEYRNPEQFYNDVERTKDAFMTYFSHDDGSPIKAVTSPNGLDLLSHLGLYDPDDMPESIAKGVEEGFAPAQEGFGKLIADFDPDKHKSICEADSNCLTQWLDVEGVPQDDFVDPSRNFCCGDDPDDVGYVNYVNGRYYVCVQNPDGRYQWVTPPMDESTLHHGNIYAVFDESHYEINTEKTSNDTWVVQERTGYPLKYDLLIGNRNIYMCQVPGLSFRGVNIPGGLASNALQYVSPGNIVELSRASGAHHYYCYEENGAGRFSECHGDNAPFNLMSRTTLSSPLWVSHSASYIHAVSRFGSFERMPLALESWNLVESGPFRATLQSLSSQGRPGSRGLAIQFSRNGTSSDGTLRVVSDILPIRDFSSYRYLEGDVWFSEAAPLNIIIDTRVIALEDYFTSSPVRNSFNHFKIDLVSENLRGSVPVIGFEIDSSLVNFRSNATYNFRVDNLNLVRDTGLKYCGFSDGKMIWVGSRDDSEESCSAIGGTHTGNFCCGDVPNQFFTDTDASCWDSNYVAYNTRFQEPTVIINGEEFTFFCDDLSRCEHSLPRLTTTGDDYLIEIVNPYPDFYDVVLRSTLSNHSEMSTDILEFTIHKYEYVARRNSIDFCGVSSPSASASSGFNFSIVPYVLSPFHNAQCVLTSDYYCSGGGGWTDNMANIEARDDPDEPIPELADGRGEMPDLSERTLLKGVPIDARINTSDANPPFQCCPSDYCWDGFMCVEDHSNEPFKSPRYTINDFGDGYRCIAGEWQLSNRKSNPFGTTYGYCSDDSQCFVSSTGSASDNNFVGSNPQCISDGQFVGDFYCEAGNWSTRTKYLASVLHDNFRTGNSFSIYCDEYSRVLNYLGHIGGKSVESYVRHSETCGLNMAGAFATMPCVNNFCVLTDGRRVAFGTTINSDVVGEMSIGELFDVDCSGVSGVGLQRCGTSGEARNWYFDSDFGIIIFGGDFQVVGSGIFDRVVGLFSGLRNWILGSAGSGLLFSFDDVQTSTDLSFIRHDHKYDKIFYLRDVNREIIAIYGSQHSAFSSGSRASYVGVRYTQFRFSSGNNVCSYTDSYDFQRGTDSFTCVFDGSSNSYYVFTQASSPPWQDLTSKLRLFE